MFDILASAGISALGNLAGGLISSGGQSAANQQSAMYNAVEAQKNRDWQERMANTAYQRAMADMKAAGLNPMLAYQQGGAGVGSGAQASMKFENAMEGLGQGVSSAAQAGRRAIELQNVAAQTANTTQQARVNEATVGYTKARELEAMQNTATTAAQQRNIDADTQLKIETSGNPAAMRKQLEASAYNQSAYGDYIKQKTWLERYGDTKVGRALTSGMEIFKSADNALTKYFNENPVYLPGYGPGGKLETNKPLEITIDRPNTGPRR